MTVLTWSDDRVEQLKKLWEAGLSAGQIVAELGNVTRNAVIGKVHRLGLSGHVKAGRPAAGPTQQAIQRKIARRPRQQPHRDEAPGIIEKFPAEAPEIAGPGISLLDLNDSNCHWPKGDWSDAATEFCGAKALTGLPYCAAHSRIAYTPAAVRRRVADDFNSKLSRARPNNYYQR